MIDRAKKRAQKTKLLFDKRYKTEAELENEEANEEDTENEEKTKEDENKRNQPTTNSSFDPRSISPRFIEQ